MALVLENKRASCLLWQAALRLGKQGVSCPVPLQACEGCSYYAEESELMTRTEKRAMSRAERAALARNRRRLYMQKNSTGLGPGRPGTLPGFSLHTCHPDLKRAYRKLYWRIRQDTDNLKLPKKDRFDIARYVVEHEDEILAGGLGWRVPETIEYTKPNGKKVVLKLNADAVRSNKADPEAISATVKLSKR